jgi:S-(hydroxymethyl)mycothiol dehydrogenase
MIRKAKAVLCRSHNQPVVVEQISVDAPKRGEVSVKLGACGVCHSDLSAINGTIALPLPLVLGHEGAGVVEEIGEGVTDLAPGDHVVFSFIYMCGKCRFCVAGRPVLCLEQGKALTTPLEGTPRVRDANGAPLGIFSGCGSMAQYATVSAENLIKIDPKIPLDCAALVGCGVTTGVGAVFNTAKVEPGSSVAVFGCGGVGDAAIAGARLAGATTIIAVDIDDRKLEWARKFGATHTVNSRETDAVEAIKSHTNGFGVDVAIDAVGHPAVFEQAFYARDLAGRVVLVGVPAPDMQITLPLIEVFGRGGAIKSSWYGDCLPSRDFPMLTGLYRQGRFPLEDFVSEAIGLDDVEEAFDNLRRGEVLRSVVVLDK